MGSQSQLVMNNNIASNGTGEKFKYVLLFLMENNTSPEIENHLDVYEKKVSSEFKKKLKELSLPQLQKVDAIAYSTWNLSKASRDNQIDYLITHLEESGDNVLYEMGELVDQELLKNMRPD